LNSLCSQAERVGERVYWSQGIEKELRKILEDEDKIRYDDLLDNSKMKKRQLDNSWV
jgi:hypothetical protein